MRAKTLAKLVTLAISIFVLSGCVTTHQPRYGADGVYFDDPPAAAGQVVLVDPGVYPFWSLDHFYFSHFSGHRRPPFANDPWFWAYDPWMHPRVGYAWPSNMLWVRGSFYSPHPRNDERLVLMQQSAGQHRHTSLRQADSEVQLRHRLAEDRALASHRNSGGNRMSRVTLGNQRSAAPTARHSQGPARQRSTAVNRPAHAQRSTQQRQQTRSSNRQHSVVSRSALAESRSPASLHETSARDHQR